MTPTLTGKQWVSSYIILALLLVMVLIPFLMIADRALLLSFLDVGQGDSILIQTPEGANVLIDAGAGSVVIDRLGEALGFFDKKIDLFVMTHPDRDHYAGVMDVLQKYKIGAVMFTGIVNFDPLYSAFIEQIKHFGISIIYPSNKKDIRIAPNTYLDVIYPFEGQSLIGKSVRNKNNSSIVLRLLYNDKSIVMLPGDAEMSEDRDLVLSGQDLTANILKLGHHGSKSSSSLLFLNAVNAKTVVVSAGAENKYGHPHPETLAKVSGLKLRSTINEGTIHFVIK